MDLKGRIFSLESRSRESKDDFNAGNIRGKSRMCSPAISRYFQRLKCFPFFFSFFPLDRRGARVSKSDFAFAGNDCFDSLGLRARLNSLRGIVFCLRGWMNGEEHSVRSRFHVYLGLRNWKRAAAATLFNKYSSSTARTRIDP